jgi:hypothetical protein
MTPAPDAVWCMRASRAGDDRIAASFLDDGVTDDELGIPRSARPPLGGSASR